ncbi:MAG TPA: efflux RND transporter periplasmic adaptor subunit [Rhizomicrobium sp.]|nr:efflux RND transporter periplasmic adaptor subunit [Rhizomicrobium sp.]
MTTEPFSLSPLRVLSALFCAAAVIFVTSCGPDNSQKASETPSNATLTDAQLRHIHIYTAVASSFHKTLDVDGVVDFDNDQATSVLAPMSGPVSRLLVQPGDHVSKGQLLAVVDSPDYAAAVAAYRKAVVAANAARRLANMDKDLFVHKGVAQKEADQAESDAVSAESDRYTALQTLVSLNIDPRTLAQIKKGRAIAHISGEIRSPMTGTVVERLITPGQLLQAGSTAAFTIANLSRVWVMAQIFDSDIGAVSVGDSAQVMTGTNTVAGRVENVSAEVDPTTRSVMARVVVNNSENLLKKQMYVHVRIQSHDATSGILAPVSAILRDDENLPFVYVRERDGSFARRPVTVGGRVGDSYEIPAGLRAGDRIVVDGAIFVQFMQDQ